MSRRSEPLTWDIYLLFLLRILHDLYGGDPAQIESGMDPVTAMGIVTDHYHCCGTPPPSLLGQLQARSTIVECSGYIRASSNASEPAYIDFLGVLNEMYIDVGGAPATLKPCEQPPEPRF